ncbi:MAG: sigma-70 family RNA polymerase sigma factor [Labilithrix sp.]|nr:sigma-70 family RNA polymerase sigma factor [Labilithrix sp.]
MGGPSEADLDGLMDRLADGDRSAFTPLFEALYPRALAVARRRLDDAHAEDAAQRTMTALFARAVEFTPGRPVLPWFYAIAANETHGVARKVRLTGLREAPESSASLVPADGDPESELAHAETRALLREAVAALDPLSAAAIEEQLAGDASRGPRSPALRKRVSRAYGRLRSLLTGLGGTSAADRASALDAKKRVLGGTEGES